jgi:hypothetical protein
MAHVDYNMKLSGRMVAVVPLFAVLFGVPAFYMMETRTGPAAWLIDLQIRLFEGYLPKATFAVLCLLEGLVVGIPLYVAAIAVKRLTGKTVVEILRKKK